MKRKFVKILSIVAAVSLMLSILPLPVFAAGEPPVLQSAAVIAGGAAVELTFDKDMADPGSGSAGFGVYFSITDKVVTAAQLDGTDSKKVRLALSTPVYGGEDVWLSYTPGTVAAADSGVLAAISYQTIINALPHPSLATTQPSGGTANVPYTHTFTLSVDGQAPYTFSAGAGLPDGLTLNTSTGELNGTPTVSGSFNFGITVTDSNSAFDGRNFTINIAEATGVCQIGATPYATLDAALAAVTERRPGHQ